MLLRKKTASLVLQVLLSSYVSNSSKDGIRCNKCNEISHKKSECTNPKATFASMDIRLKDATEKDDKKKLLRENPQEQER